MKTTIEGIEFFKNFFEIYAIPDDAIEVSKNDFINFLDNIPYKRDKGHSVRIYYIPRGAGFMEKKDNIVAWDTNNGSKFYINKKYCKK